MARTKIPAPTTPSFSSSSTESEDHVHLLTPTSGKRISKPTAKVQASAKDKGKQKATKVEKKPKTNPKPAGPKLMGDAMRAAQAPKRKRNDTEPTPPSPTPTPAAPIHDEDVSLLSHFASEADYHEFKSEFGNRRLHDARMVDFRFFDSQRFTFQNTLRSTGLARFLGLSLDYFPVLTQVFYYNLDITDTGFTSSVHGIPIEMTFQEFSDLTGLPYRGQYLDAREEHAETGWSTDVVRSDVLNEIMEPGFVESTTIPCGQMKVETRLLQYTLTRMILPRLGNHAVVQNMDLPFLWGLTKSLDFSWVKIILTGMQAGQARHQMLPYPCLISLILNKFQIPRQSDERVPAHSILRFGEGAINQMKIKWIDRKWSWSHKAQTTSTQPPSKTTEVEEQPTMEQLLKTMLNEQRSYYAEFTEFVQSTNRRLNAIEDNIHQINTHLSLTMSFNDIADIGRAAATTDTAIPTDSPTAEQPHVEDSLAETNTAARASDLGDNEDIAPDQK